MENQKRGEAEGLRPVLLLSARMMSRLARTRDKVAGLTKAGITEWEDRMVDVRSSFSQELSEGKRLVLMPVSRFMIEQPFRIDHFAFYPAGWVDLAALRTVPNYELATNRAGTIQAVQGQPLRELQSNLAGASPDVLNNHVIVAFPYELDWEGFLNSDHGCDVDLLLRLSEYADRAMDIIKLHFCTLSVPNSIPGRVGTWGGSGECLSALLYNLPDNESYLIAGRGVVTRIVAGLGLELVAGQCTYSMRLPIDGEVGNIVRHGLMLFSDLMDSNNETVTFARAMTLLEFLASPDMYEPWKKLKGEIVSHLAKSKTEYHTLCQRFRDLTSEYRTPVVHRGKRLQDLLPRQPERAKLFAELSGYCYTLVNDMIVLSQMTWEELKLHRKDLRTAIGIVD